MNVKDKYKPRSARITNLRTFIEQDDVAAGCLHRQEIADLALYLKAIREEMSLSQVQVAERARLSQPEICRMEGGTSENGPRFGSITRYLRACGARLLVSWDESEKGEVVSFTERHKTQRRRRPVAQPRLRLVSRVGP